VHSKKFEAERGTYRFSYFQRFLGDLFVVLVLLTYLLYCCLVGVVLLEVGGSEVFGCADGGWGSCGILECGFTWLPSLENPFP
jgi:hypothetical protein